mmetsp:Transcript_83294/g.258626  ORF Transcript_83294/g.258626 Transcript_83294/m.258626 type:complete len:518 (-) Transcript_83294:28-1581(-)
MMAHHFWFDHYYEYTHIEAWILAVLGTLTLAFELTAHHVGHRAKHHGHAVAKDHQYMEEHRVAFMQRSAPLSALLIERTGSELMVLGFLAWVVWSFNRGNFFVAVVCWFQDYEAINLPATSHDYVEVVEDVHMTLFLAMVMFLAIGWVTIRLTEHGQGRWASMNDALADAQKETPKELLDFRSFVENSSDPAITNRFLRSRQILFWRITASCQTEDDEETDKVEQMIVDALYEICELKGMPDNFNRDDLTMAFNDWFPFDEYCACQQHSLLDDFLELKAASWLYIIFTFVIVALAGGIGRSLSLQLVFVAIMMFVAVGVGFFVPLVFQWSDIQKKIDHHHTSDLKHVHGMYVSFSKLPVDRFPMFTVQLWVLMWCYNCMRILANNTNWHDEHQTRQLAAVITLFATLISVPFLGWMVHYLVNRLSLWIARGDMKLQRVHLSWIVQLSERHLRNLHHQRAKEKRRALRSNSASTSKPLTASNASVVSDWARAEARAELEMEAGPEGAAAGDGAQGDGQ